jgi:arylsulfatase
MAAADTPNVLLICADHWSGNLLGCAGHPVVMTPTIDSLARGGVLFRNAFSACPICIPARRTLMTGLTARGHGDRKFDEHLPMPEVPTLAACFHDAGYQSFAVGKLHVYPQRNRIGFDDVILNEEGRRHLDGGADDWELYLLDRGYGGQEYASGLANNDYLTRSWHLPEHCHPSNWAASQMCRVMHRRDPQRPAFWYLSFVGPHPPVWPLQAYMDLYREVPLDEPVCGDWSRAFEQLPLAVRRYNAPASAWQMNPHALRLARQAFYATVTHIDHQIRVVIGYLREQGLLDNTIIAFTADHGDMLGDHHMWAKKVMYEPSIRVPLVISPRPGDSPLALGQVDDRLVELADVMPTLLEMCGLSVPPRVQGRSLLSPHRREHLYGECGEGAADATRMIRTGRHKLIYYPAGNQAQLFDMLDDPREQHDLAADPRHAQTLVELQALLIQNLYGQDQQWVRQGTLIGDDPADASPLGQNPRNLRGQRGIRMM